MRQAYGILWSLTPRPDPASGYGAVTPAFVPGIPAKNPHPSPGTVQGGPGETMAGAGFFFGTIREDPEHFSGSPKGKRP
ncbi:MAG: hypothetical protein WBL34_07200 [Methanoregula sp.]